MKTNKEKSYYNQLPPIFNEILELKAKDFAKSGDTFPKYQCQISNIKLFPKEFCNLINFEKNEFEIKF
jgi:hypothetical protein